MRSIRKKYHQDYLDHLISVENSKKAGIIIKRKKKSNDGISIYDKYKDDYKCENDCKDILKGDILVVRFFKMLFNIKHYDWYDYQIMLLPYFLEASIRSFYKEEWDINANYIKNQYNFKKLNNIVLSCAPRRDGKTTVVSAWFAIMALLMKGIIINVFIINERYKLTILHIKKGIILIFLLLMKVLY